MRRAFVVLNPVAGTSDERAIKEALQSHLSPPDWSYECYRTTGEERVTDIVRSAMTREFDLYVAVGGDGTVAGVAGALVHSGKPLGIIPAGTGNALARDLGLPLDAQDAVALLSRGPGTKTIDVLQVESRYYVLNIGAGLSAKMMRDATRNEKRIVGQLAYLWSGVEELSGLRKQPFDVSIDGRSLRLEAVDVLVLNSAVIGIDHARWGSQSKVDDGQAEVVALEPDHPLDLVPYMWERLLRPSGPGPQARQWVARQHVVIRTDPPLPVQADGEIIGDTPVEVRLVPQALRVAVEKHNE